jgi:hypothetical protein
MQNSWLRDKSKCLFQQISGEFFVHGVRRLNGESRRSRAIPDGVRERQPTHECVNDPGGEGISCAGDVCHVGDISWLQRNNPTIRKGDQFALPAGHHPAPEARVTKQ